MTTFKELGLSRHLLSALTAEGLSTPTPIQAQAIPPQLENRDVIAIAQTGTGKTAAFLLPMLDMLCQRRERNRPKSCRFLVLSPTRELALQIERNARELSGSLNPRTVILVGGVKPGPQIQKLKGGTELLIATPGRLEDLLSQNALQLGDVETVVLDEADQMLDLGFYPAIRRIMGKLPAKRQTVMVSATMPAKIKSLAAEFQNDPLTVAVAPAAKPIDRIEQSVQFLPKEQKRERLTQLLQTEDVTSAIVFTRTKRGADRLCKQLVNAGIGACAIHGNKSQNQRERALSQFRNGETPVLVATDVAARGIDIDDVSHVFNFELPNVAEAYVHRIGRTARAGKSGQAISLCDASEKELLADIEKLIGRKIRSSGNKDIAPAPETQGRPKQKPEGMKAKAKPASRRKRSRKTTSGTGSVPQERSHRGGHPLSDVGFLRNSGCRTSSSTRVA
ncbi:DEAD/DEAH box helicase [Emcibacter nanhaiensis]|uniref:DEAD/DEAH box helicase n=1 Tax=Emcibacter nanhaiensis TaxID=1505037 RepID=A0A501PFY1_9PROT|nr:DEAD/DEAH box helicase [Emcibacter nanhaiensis]TPD58912.1 DEAD/DEAH box helicase [Emcibacter nanhaiensis]